MPTNLSTNGATTSTRHRFAITMTAISSIIPITRGATQFSARSNATTSKVATAAKNHRNLSSSCLFLRFSISFSKAAIASSRGSGGVFSLLEALEDYVKRQRKRLSRPSVTDKINASDDD